MYHYHLLRVFSYPHVKDYRKLPKKPGLYYVVRNNKVLYVGLAGEDHSNLHQRWNGYKPHKMSFVFDDERGSGRLYYRVLPRKKLRYVEALEIQRFKPSYNIQRPNPSKYCAKWGFIDLLFLSLLCVLFFFIVLLLG